METRKVVEIGCGSGIENMSSNLIINHGYQGYLLDGSKTNIEFARSFYRSRKDCLLTIPVLSEARVTRENVDDKLSQLGAEGEIDLLSIDVDGIDWHIWNAITVIRPRLCVFETADFIPGDLSLTVPYVSDFDYKAFPVGNQDFRSSSLAAMVKLSGQKGYRLIGAHKHGFNAFFLREDLVPELLPEVSISSVHENPWTQHGQRHRWPAVRDLPWIKV